MSHGGVTQALAVIYDPSSTSEARQAAQKFCDDFKETAGPEYGLHFAHVRNGLGDMVRHFGLHLLEHIVKTRWDIGSDADKQAIKDAVLSLMHSGTMPIQEERVFLKEKLCQLVAEMAVRDWPQRWLQLTDQLVTLMSMGPSQAELALLALRTLSDDVFHGHGNGTIPDARRSDLLAGLTAVSPTLLPLMIKILQDHAMTAATIPAHETLSVAALKAMACFCEWIAIPMVKEYNLYDLLVRLLPLTPALRLGACEVLLVIVARRVRPEERDILLHFVDFVEHFQNALAAAGPVIENNRVNESVYTFQKRVAMIFAAFGTHQITAKGVKAPANMRSYLQTLLGMYSHDSLLISSFSGPFWLAILKQQNDFITTELLVDLIRRSAPKMIKVGDPELENSPTCLFSAVDFDTVPEFRRFYAVLRRRLMDIIRLATQLEPIASLDHVNALFVDLVQQQGPILSKSEKTTVQSTLYLLWDGRVTLLEAAFQGIGVFQAHKPTHAPGAGAAALDPKIRALCRQLLQLIIQDTVNEPLILARRLSAMQSFGPYFVHDVEPLQACLNMIFASITYTLPEEKTWPLSMDSMSLRRKGASTLLRLARDIPVILLPLLPSLLNMFQSLDADKRVTEGERSQILEALLVISLASTDAAVRSQIINELFAPLVEQLGASRIHGHVRDVASFIRGVGIETLFSQGTGPRPDVPIAPNLVPALQQAQQSRRELFYTLNTTFVLLRCVNDNMNQDASGATPAQHPLASIVPLALPLVAQTISVLHALWNPQSWPAGIPATLQAEVLAITTYERNSFLGDHEGTGGGGGGAYDTEDASTLVSSSSITIASELAALRLYLYNLRVACYQFMGQLTQVRDVLYATPSFAQIVTTSTFANIDFIELRHWRHLLTHYIKPVITSCPAEAMPLVLTPILPSLFAYLSHKLNAEWVAFDAPQDDAKQTDYLSTIIGEKVLRDVTRACTDIFTVIFSSATPQATKDQDAAELAETAAEDEMDGNSAPQIVHSADHLSMLIDYLLTQQDVCASVLTFIVAALSWHDTISCRRSVAICEAVVTWDASHQHALATFIARDVFIGGLRALHDGYHEDGHNSLIGLVTRIYSELRQHTNLSHEVLLSLPGVTPASVQAFEAEFFKNSQERKRRSAFRKFLSDFIGKSVGQWFSARVNIRALPEKLFIHQPGRRFAGGDVDGDEPNGVVSLFEQN